MKTVVNTCDLCKQSKSETDLAQITCNSKGLLIGPNRYSSTINIDVCRDCLKKKGFIVENVEVKEAENVDKHNKKKLEEKILDILYDLGVVFHE